MLTAADAMLTVADAMLTVADALLRGTAVACQMDGATA